MMVRRMGFLAASTTILVMACATTAEPQSVDELLRAADAADGGRVSVRGILQEDHKLFNLYAQGGKQCVGLLIPESRRSRFSSLVGKKVRVSGTLDAEGCGRRGICDEHLCGPAILTDVELLDA